MQLNLSAESITTINQVAANALIIILLSIGFYFISDTLWKWHYADTDTIALPAVAVVTPAKKPAPQSPAVWNWFQIEQEQKKKVAEVSKINARLTGVIGLGQKGIAFIELDGKSQQPFKVGDMLKEGIVLKSLGIDHVVLLRGEEEELLRIKKTNLFASAEEKEEEKLTLKERAVAKENAANLAEILRDEPIKLMDIIKFEQIKVKKYGLGYKISPRTSEQKATFSALGFESGDVVFTINNKAVVQLAGDPNAVSQLLSADNLDIKLLRGQNIENVSVSLN